jgi:ABC-type uncharacterized transport system substrate-binding protein
MKSFSDGLIMKKICVFLVICILLTISCEKEKQTGRSLEKKKISYVGKKILVVQSYHPELKGVIEKNDGIEGILDKVDIEYRIIYMDTKRNTDEKFKEDASLKIKKIIEQYEPDVVITFDDNAFKYLIIPHYKNSKLPVVFAGIDWDVSEYGAPFTNTTGIISVTLVTQLVDYLQKYAKGNRISWLGYDTFTARKQTKAYKEILGLNMSTHYVKNFQEWKITFLKLQTEADMIVHSGILPGMEDWDENKAKTFVLKNIKVPVGTVNKLIMCCAVFGLTKVGSEQGEWAAKTALEIVSGKKPSNIPLTRNKKGNIILNLDIAEKLDITFEAKILKNAQIF